MDDREIIAAYRATADPELFRMLVERHQERVFRLAVSILGPAFAGEAEEVSQDVFLQVHRKLDGFREDAALSSWLYRIAWNMAVDRRRRVRFTRPTLPEAAMDSMAGTSDPYAEMELKQRRSQVVAALETLPELYRTLIHLYYWMDCSLAEIRDLTGVAEGTAKSYLARARARLEKELER